MNKMKRLLENVEKYNNESPFNVSNIGKVYKRQKHTIDDSISANHDLKLVSSYDSSVCMNKKEFNMTIDATKRGSSAMFEIKLLTYDKLRTLVCFSGGSYQSIHRSRNPKSYQVIKEPLYLHNTLYDTLIFIKAVNPHILLRTDDTKRKYQPDFKIEWKKKYLIEVRVPKDFGDFDIILVKTSNASQNAIVETEIEVLKDNLSGKK